MANRKQLHVESLESRQVLSAAGWSTAFGDVGADEGNAVDTDSSGNAYVGGEVNDQFFFAKYDSTGNRLWNRSGTSSSGGGSKLLHLAADSVGNSYAGGSFSGQIEFTSGVSLTAVATDGSSSDGFLAKFDSGGYLQWIHQFSDAFTRRADIAIYESPGGNHIYVTGENQNSLTFDMEDVLENELGHRATFLIDMLDSGSSANLMWAKQVQDIGRVRPEGLTVDASGHIFLSGGFYEGGGRKDEYPTASIGGQLLFSNGSYDPFVAKFSADGNTVWAHHLGGGGALETADDVAVDQNGSVYVAGTFWVGTEIGGVRLESSPNRSSYIAKVTEGLLGPSVSWARNIGGNDQGQAFVRSMSIDESTGSSGTSLYLSGVFNETVDFDPDPNQQHFVTSPVPDPNEGGLIETGDQGFLLRIDGAGDFEEVWQYGSGGRGVSVDNGVAYVTGYFDESASMMVSDNLLSSGDNDGFLMRVDSNAPTVVVAEIQPIVEGDSATLTATAIDRNDGDLSANVDWTLDGVAVQADSSTVTLNGFAVGTHTLVASVTDSDGTVGTYTLTIGVVPAAPTSLIASAINGTSVTLTWTDNSAGETGFIIERAIQPKGKADLVWETVGAVGANVSTFTDDPGASANYIYRVLAIYVNADDILQSEWSTELHASLSDGDGGGKGGGKPNK